MTVDLGLVFGAGLLTFLSPCVLPLVPIYLSSLAGGDFSKLAHTSRRTLVWRAALFSLGFTVVFTLFGLGATAVGSALGQYRPALRLFGALLVLLFALKFIGFISIPLLDRTLRADDRRLQTGFGGLNAFMLGTVFAAGWSPCVGPILGTVLGYTAATTSNPVVGAAYLALFSLGFATPLMLAATTAGVAMPLLRKINQFLPTLEKVTGVFLLGVAIWLMGGAVGAPSGVPEECLEDVAHRAAAPSASEQDRPQLPSMVALVSNDCGVCTRMKPTLESVVNECEGHGVKVRVVDLSDSRNRALATQYRLVGLPTFLFLDEEGAEVVRLVGEQSAMGLKRAISTIRGEPCPGVGPLPRSLSDDTDEKSGAPVTTGPKSLGQMCPQPVQDPTEPNPANPIKCAAP